MRWQLLFFNINKTTLVFVVLLLRSTYLRFRQFNTRRALPWLTEDI